MECKHCGLFSRDDQAFIVGEHEHVCCEIVNYDPVQVDRDATCVRIDDYTIMVNMPNGGHVRIESETPLVAFCKPQ